MTAKEKESSPKLEENQDEDDEEAIDQGFDFVNFPNLTTEEQIASIPLAFLENIEFDEVDHARSHPTCSVKKHHPNHNGSWACDKVAGASTCLSGITDFY